MDGSGRSSGLLRRMAPEWSQEAGAGVSTGLVVAAQSLTHGMVAFAPLGVAAAATGMGVALAVSAAAGLCTAALAASRPLVGTTTAATALVTASVLVTAEPVTPAEGILFAMLLALLAGLFMLAMARSGIARVASHIPTPVTIGMANGVVALIFVGQAPVALGLTPGQAFLAEALRPASLAVAGAAFALMARPVPLFPAPITALAVATLLHQALAGAGFALGPVVGAAPSPAHVADAVLGAIRAAPALADWQRLPSLLATAAASLALLATTEILMAAAALRERSGRRVKPDRDVMGGGAAMLAGGMLGGLPASALTSASVACHDLGGRGRPAMLTRAMVALLALAFAGPLIAMLPFAALAGVLMGAVLRLLKLRPLFPKAGPGRVRRSADAAVIAAVVAVALLFGLIAAIAAGVVISIGIFTLAMSRSAIRRSTRNPVGRSRVRRPAEDEELLREAGDRIVVLELQGATFFGSGEGILLQIEQLLAAGAKLVILDLSRVTWVDLSGAQRLLEACRAWPSRVLLAPLHPGSGAEAEFEAYGLRAAIPRGAGFESLAAAVEAAEEQLLRSLRPERPSARSASEALHALGLPPSAEEFLLARMQEIDFAAGTMILRAGDPADAVYILLEGQVVVSLPAAANRPATRLAVLAPGIVFGESALLGAARRSADATARQDVRCLRITVADVQSLREASLEVAWLFMTAVLRQLASNVAAANATIDRLEE
ncbi:SulP family inorganic anion transporter [Sabulicella rubraurantiaca]|uniref:SulP family inorganic anion transporter n=1 Tax=Sabulicella rubraurantiaca TaxID=2811429 RepID=UPI001A977EBF|nr:SulP family inorganic anion transporter [Sabulicella rubraurantiaca]